MGFGQVFHVEPAPEGGWLGRVEDEEGRTRTLATFATRELALNDVVERARREPFSKVVVWRADAVFETYEQVPDAEEPSGGLRSSVSVRGHPVHPMIVPFVIAALFSAAVTDTIFVVAGDPYWAELSFWLLGVGFFAGLLAAAVGLVDLVSLKAARSPVGLAHFLLNLVLLAVTFSNFGLRLVDRVDNVAPAGIVLSWIGAATLLVSGWMGYALTYKKRIGVFG
jgi:uncharacterized membrane protein